MGIVKTIGLAWISLTLDVGIVYRNNWPGLDKFDFGCGKVLS